jgi:hypothetical protein
VEKPEQARAQFFLHDNGRFIIRWWMNAGQGPVTTDVRRNAFGLSLCVTLTSCYVRAWNKEWIWFAFAGSRYVPCEITV